MGSYIVFIGCLVWIIVLTSWAKHIELNKLKNPSDFLFELLNLLLCSVVFCWPFWIFGLILVFAD